MKEATLITIATQALVTVAKIAGPVLIASLAVGLFISLIQSVTQIQDFTLTFVPKLAAIAVVFFVAGHFMLSTMIGFTTNLYHEIPALLSSG